MIPKNGFPWNDTVPSNCCSHRTCLGQNILKVYAPKQRKSWACYTVSFTNMLTRRLFSSFMYQLYGPTWSTQHKSGIRTWKKIRIYFPCHSTIPSMSCYLPSNGCMASEEIHYDPGSPTMYKKVAICGKLRAHYWPSLLLWQLQFHSFNLVTERVSTWSREEFQLDCRNNSNLITEGAWSRNYQLQLCSQKELTP